ncbi:hypothetical protein Tco_0870820 [Tanacetum coccineum]
MTVRPVWKKKLNYCNTSNEVDVNLPTPMPKPQSPLKESSQETPPTTFSNHDSQQPHSIPFGDSCDTNVGQAFIPPQSVNQTQLTQPSFAHLLINPHVASVLHAQTPPSPHVMYNRLDIASLESTFGLVSEIGVDLTKEFLSLRFSMKDMGEADVILVDKLSRYTSNPGTQHWQAIQRVLKYLKKTMDYRLTYIGYPSVLEGYTDACWISNTGDNFVYKCFGLSACCCAATLAKAYSQMYNGKSRHLGVRHSMIRELITKIG